MWQINIDTDSGFLFDVCESGLVVTGTARHFFRPSADTGVDMSTIGNIPAKWSIYRASEAYKSAHLIGLDVKTMKSCLDESSVKDTHKPICTISYHGDCVWFSALLPDHYFFNAIDIFKLIAGGVQMKCWFNFEFIGFLPRQVPGEVDFVSYEDWLAGKPYLCRGDNQFMLRAQQGTSEA